MQTPLNLTCDIAEPSASVERNLALIWYDRGQLAVRRIDDDVTLGVDPSCDIWIEGGFVSRRHCRIVRRAGRWQIVDCASRNGTYLDERRVERTTFEPPALLRLGEERLTLVEEVRSPVTAPYYSFGPMVGRDPSTLDVFHQLNLYARNEFPVLILGPTGSGKELCAQAIHRLSKRAGKAFLPLNCAALPAELAEAELFGAVRGAYTGAQGDREGVFRAADGGTLFLDEVGDLTPAIQAKLLRALESSSVRPVGGSRARPVDVRVVSATNRPIADAGQFRHDLFHRLAVLTLCLKPLAERPDDVTALLDHFARLEGMRAPGRELFEAVARCSFSGNARELRQLVRRFSVSGGQLELPTILSEPKLALDVDGYRPAGVSEREAFAILQALRAHRGNRAQAARSLGMPRSTFFFKLRRIALGLAPHQRYLLDKPDRR